VTNNEPAGARTPAWPLPDARQLRRALESLGITAHSRSGTRNPVGERGDAAQYAGILHAYLEQIETGLRGGELQTQFQKGWLTGYDRNNAGALGGIAERLDDLSRFAGAGIGQVPLASRQFSTAALALLVATPLRSCPGRWCSTPASCTATSRSSRASSAR
jgi:hypothetical protein